MPVAPTHPPILLFCSKLTCSLAPIPADLSAGGPRHYDPGVYTKQREELMAILPDSQEELPPRRMLDSFDSAVIPLGSDPVLRDRSDMPTQEGLSLDLLVQPKI